MATLFMESTEIAAEKTASQIIGLLVQAKCSHVMQEFSPSGEIIGLTFVLRLNEKNRPFKLPVNTDPVFKLINGRRRSSWDRSGNAIKDREQSKRVAWRQLFRWVEAQLAMIQCGMVKAEQVFFPYMETEPGRTVFDEFEASEAARMLPAPEPEDQ